MVVLALLFTIGTAAAQADNTTGQQVTEISDDIEPYNGPFGPDSALYGLKISMENLDEVFTFNESERVEKQLNHAKLRIAEVRRELEANRAGSAERALELYWQKINQTEMSVAPFPRNATGLLHAQEMITKHQFVLSSLLLSHPNNTGLARAYNNSLALEQKFEQKTETRFERSLGKDNRTILKAVRLEAEEENRAGAGDGRHAETEVRERDGNKDTGKGPAQGTHAPTVTAQPGRTGVSPSATATPQETRAAPKELGNNNGKGNGDDKEHGRSHTK
jgi:hypothetical protein